MSTIYSFTKFKLDRCININGDLLSDRLNTHIHAHTHIHKNTNTQTETDTLSQFRMGRVKYPPFSFEVIIKKLSVGLLKLCRACPQPPNSVVILQNLTGQSVCLNRIRIWNSMVPSASGPQVNVPSLSFERHTKPRLS